MVAHASKSGSIEHFELGTKFHNFALYQVACFIPIYKTIDSFTYQVKGVDLLTDGACPLSAFRTPYVSSLTSASAGSSSFCFVRGGSSAVAILFPFKVG
jgi:hypothetical protein